MVEFLMDLTLYHYNKAYAIADAAYSSGEITLTEKNGMMKKLLE